MKFVTLTLAVMAMADSTQSMHLRQSVLQRISSSVRGGGSDASTASGTAITGGWCVNHDCNNLPDGFDRVNGGSFQATSLNQGPSIPGPAGYASKFVTFGGEGVYNAQGTGNVISKENLRSAVTSFSATGLDFDLEGGLAKSEWWQPTLENALGLKAESPELQIQLTVMGSPNVFDGSTPPVLLPGAQDIPWLEANDAKFDYVALMLYGQEQTDAGWAIPLCHCGTTMTADNPGGATWGFIEPWIDSEIPNSKIVLSMTTNGLAQHHVDFFQQLVDKHGLAGISFWNAKELPAAVSLPVYGKAPTVVEDCPSAPPHVVCDPGFIYSNFSPGATCGCYDATSGATPCEQECP